ncbi:hypothetical protein [Psychrobacter sp. I-STPA10]|uniref:hypothetical protein n=1 Tax=Psychrobacter sp. I-STPA10 TaxID=2585769 RepID=UPI001E5B2C0F|nr:hypothetical protein [Psychrobacter sp. I-STPA10]
MILDKFSDNNIHFTYDEIEINLIKTLHNYQVNTTNNNNKSNKNINEKYLQFYQKLPIYYRGKNMIRVSLCLTDEEFTLDSLFQDISNAFNFIISKKNTKDTYDPTSILSSIDELKQQLANSNLLKTHQYYQQKIKQQAIDKRIQEREIRKQLSSKDNLDNKILIKNLSNKPYKKPKLIYDLRFYYRFYDIGKLYFTPYDHRLCDKILEKLRQRKFCLPSYTHIYIMVSDNIDNALYHAVRGADWFVYGIAIFKEYADYPQKSEQEKKKIVFNLIKQGLIDVAEIDNLDKDILYEVLDEVETNMLYDGTRK